MSAEEGATSVEEGQNGAGPGEVHGEAAGRRHEDDDEVEDDIREGETPEEALQRRIEEGRVGKGKSIRRWRDTEEKQRLVETGRYQSKVQRYGKIYEEVKALRRETQHSVQDLRERFKDKGVIQNKDQFIVRLIAQERNEQEGKVAAIRSLQQWRLTDVELHNFLNRCHKKGLAGKLELARQWVFEQQEAGGNVSFKEGLAFYSSIGILQPRSSAQTQQQWREWREWEDAMTSALEDRKAREGTSEGDSPEPAGPDASCNEDSTVCNSPWSSERGGGGSFGGFSGTLRSSSAHGEGDIAGGSGCARFRSASGTAPETTKDGVRVARTRGRAPSNRESPRRQQHDLWTWRSYSPPSSAARQEDAEIVRKVAAERKSAGANGTRLNGSGTVAASTTPSVDGRPPSSSTSPLPILDPPEAAEAAKPAESVVRASGGYLPPRHPLASLQLSPAGPPSGGALGASGPIEMEAESLKSGTEWGAPYYEEPPITPAGAASRRGTRARGAARTLAKGPAGSGTPKVVHTYHVPAPTEEEGKGKRGNVGRKRTYSGRRAMSGDERSRSLSGVLSGLADWLMPGMDARQRRGRGRPESKELIMDVYPTAPGTPPSRRVETKSAPATPRGRPKASSILREGGWFYNGDSDYSTDGDDEGYESEDEGFWVDAGTIEPPPKLGGGGGESILDRLKRLFR